MDEPLFEPVRDFYGEIARWTPGEASRVAVVLARIGENLRRAPQGLAVGCLRALKELQQVYENGLAGAVSDTGRREMEAVLRPVLEEIVALEAGMGTAVRFEGMDLLSLPPIRRCLAFLAELHGVCACAAQENLPVEILPD